MYRATFHFEKVLYIQSDGIDYYIIDKHLNENICDRYTFSTSEDANKIEAFVDLLISKHSYDRIVVDGTNERFITHLIHTLPVNFMLVICTSFNIPKMTTLQEDYYNIDRFILFSWILSDYELANELHTFENDFSFEEINERYYYGGGSVRFFLYNPEKTIRILRSKIFQCHNIWDYVEGKVSAASSMVVNSLIAIHGEFKYTIVSKFVLKCLSLTVNQNIIARIRNIHSGNPAWQDWITEYEVLLLISQSELVLWDMDNNLHSWKNLANIIEFYTENEVNSQLCQSNMWILPKKWNQGCFDGLYLNETHVGWFILITDSTSHTFKLKYLIPFIDHLKLHTIKLIVICRRHNFNEFLIPTHTSLISEQLPEIKIKLNQYYREQYNDMNRNGPPAFEISKLCYEHQPPQQPSQQPQPHQQQQPQRAKRKRS